MVKYKLNANENLFPIVVVTHSFYVRIKHFLQHVLNKGEKPIFTRKLKTRKENYIKKR